MSRWRVFGGGIVGLNLLLLVVGLVICFGGIYIRKVCSAILGLIWGALCSFAVILMTVDRKSVV